jgi:ferredoxin-NADP reductase
MEADGTLQLVFDCVPDGLGSTYLAGLDVGAPLEIINCMGNFVLPDDLQPNLLFIVRYTGLVPVFALLKHLEAHQFQGPIHLIYASPTRSEAFYLEALGNLALAGFTFEHIYLDEEAHPLPEADAASAFTSGRSLDTLSTFICGVGAMVRPLRKQLVEMGFHKKQIRSERFN